LGNVQTAIKSVDRAFGLVDLQLMRLDQEVFRDRFFATSIREGIYRILVLYMTGEASRAEVHFAIDKSPSLKSFKNSREILTGWLRGLGNPERSAQSIRPRSSEQREVEENDTPSSYPRQSKRRGLDRQKELERVMSSQTQIESLLKEGKVDWAIENTRALIEEQIRKSGNEFACKTLSSLAASAQELGMHKLQLEWARGALSLNPDDPVVATQVAHAMLKNGGINEALVAYDHVIKQFPGDVVARTGYVCVLVDQKEYDRALRQIEIRLGPSPIPQTQDDWIDFHIRAMIYLKKGDLVAAEQDMLFGLKHCQLSKSKAYFASGLAIVQMKQNAPRDALQTMTKENSFLPVPQLIRGLVLYENLDLQTAIAEIDQLDDAVPFIHKIRHEMKLKYIYRFPASQSTDWFLDQLSNLLLAA
jgi:hypothetical protein